MLQLHFVVTDASHLVSTFDLNEATFYSQRPHLQFSVKACQSAYVALSTLIDTLLTNTYMVDIGLKKNSQSSIEVRHGRHVKRTVADTPRVLSCHSHTQLWLSWQGGVVSLGVGSVVGANLLVTFVDQDPFEVNVISMASNEGTRAVWRVPKDLGLVDL